MSTALGRAIGISWGRNASYGVRLVADVPGERFVAQPVAGARLNHPAWILSHLTLYAEVAVKLARGEAFEDPAEHRYGAKSVPLEDAGEYEPAAAQIERWTRVHEAGSHALERLTAELEARETPLARWRGVHPTIGDMLVTLMVKHEAGHLGQLSAWRRACGYPSVPM